MINIHDRLLKIILLIVLGASVLGILASNLFIYPSFTKMLIKHTESEAVMVGNHMSAMIFPEDSRVSAAHMTRNQRQINQVINEFSIYKLKVFDTYGETIFSTDRKDIGVKNTHDYFHSNVAKGQIVTKIARKNSPLLDG